MADVFQGLSQLTTINDRNAVDLGVNDLYDDAPLLKALAATVASNGTQHKYLKETAAPVVGFRAVNTGICNTIGTDVLVTIDLKILDASHTEDKALADGYFKGSSEFVARESRRHMRAAMFAAERQIVNGTGADSDGFTGLAQAVLLANPMTVNATGTTAATASSVYLIRTNDLGTDVEVVIGQGGNIVIGDTIIARVNDADGCPFPGYFTPIEAWMGLQVGSAYSVGRIANLTADSGKGLNDAKIAAALALFPASRQPNLIVMGRRSRSQLQASRTATNMTGAPAPIPDEAFGIPIVVTDAIGGTEALLT